MEITSITAFLGSVKTATDIAKAIKDAGATLEQAEAKFKIAELISLLADAKIQAAEIQESFLEKDKRIKELEQLFNVKKRLVRHQGKYYESDETGKHIGDPFCSNCWDSEHKAIYLTQIQDDYFVCPKCKNSYGVQYFEEPSSASFPLY